MTYAYSTKASEQCARAAGINLPISRKQGIMICQHIRGKTIQQAKKILEQAIKLTIPIPFSRYNNGLGHKAGMAAGCYPSKACKEVLKLLKSAEANAQFKGLGTAKLVIKNVIAQKGNTTQRHGRRFRKAKRTHLEITIEEAK